MTPEPVAPKQIVTSSGSVTAAVTEDGAGFTISATPGTTLTEAEAYDLGGYLLGVQELPGSTPEPVSELSPPAVPEVPPPATADPTPPAGDVVPPAVATPAPATLAEERMAALEAAFGALEQLVRQALNQAPPPPPPSTS